MYQVRINADPEHFLDWDKPRDQLSPKVQEWVKANHPDVWDKSADGSSLYQLLQKSAGHDGASNALREAGIPGLKYLDQGSRTAGEGSRNYVVFDDKLININKKYANAASPQTAMLMSALASADPVTAALRQRRQQQQAPQ